MQQLRTEFWTTIGEVNLADLVFVDEAGVNIAMTRLYARSAKGSRAYGECPDQRGKNVTMVGALSLKGLIAALTFQGGTVNNAFYTFVTKVLVPNLWQGACVVMDNFRSHKVAAVQKAIEAAGATLVYLSPYSPDFNPIENCWSKVKEFLRSIAARSYEAMLPYARAQFSSTFEVIEFGHPKRLKHLVTIHNYEPVSLQTRV